MLAFRLDMSQLYNKMPVTTIIDSNITHPVEDK